MHIGIDLANGPDKTVTMVLLDNNWQIVGDRRVADLYKEHGDLVSKKWFGGMSSRDRRRLRVVRKLLDRDEMARLGPGLKRMERRIWWQRAGIN